MLMVTVTGKINVNKLTCHSRAKTMAPPALHLPSEVWNQVFGYLSAADKFSVRASCKYFKKLVDHGSLWKDWSVVLDYRNRSYNSQFWASLRRRRVTSVVVRNATMKNCEQLALSLPAVNTVVLEDILLTEDYRLPHFPNLKRLAIRVGRSSVSLYESTVPHPQQLTHLTICQSSMTGTKYHRFLSVVSAFPNLTSLVCHKWFFGKTMWLLHGLLSCLPKLKHLSLNVVYPVWDCHNNSKPIPGPSAGADAPLLSSLEIIDCKHDLLPADMMRLMPGLKSLAVFYNHSHFIPDRSPAVPDSSQLKTWLSDLPQLSSLVIVKGPPVNKYVTSIPATVTSLTLCVAGLSSDMAAVSVQVPNLMHLHIDAWPDRVDVAQIPQLFPKLKSLKLRLEGVRERDFLHLHQLKDLEYLEILDNYPHLSGRTGKLQALTNYRLQVTTAPHRRDVFSCTCVSQVY